MLFRSQASGTTIDPIGRECESVYLMRQPASFKTLHKAFWMQNATFVRSDNHTDKGYADLIRSLSRKFNCDDIVCKRYRVGVERRKNKYNKSVSLSEAVVVVEIDGKKKLSVSESLDEHGNDRGPVNALAGALAKDLGKYQDIISDMKLIDYKVRITAGGTEAVTRVLIDSEDSEGRRWSTSLLSLKILTMYLDRKSVV